jgi:hypothetical protein
MRILRGALLLQVLVCAASVQPSETLEVGVIGGYGFARDYSLTGPSGSAKAGFANGVAGGAYFGGDTYQRWGGEVRYLYRMSDLRLNAPNGSANFDARTHIVTGEILSYFRPRASKTRPFVAFGGGVKNVKSTGIESAVQPGGRFAGLTNSRELLATIVAGAGVKYSLSKNLRVRFEVKDYISQRPGKLIVPAPGVKASGILNDIIGTASIGYTW